MANQKLEGVWCEFICDETYPPAEGTSVVVEEGRYTFTRKGIHLAAGITKMSRRARLCVTMYNNSDIDLMMKNTTIAGQCGIVCTDSERWPVNRLRTITIGQETAKWVIPMKDSRGRARSAMEILTSRQLPVFSVK